MSCDFIFTPDSAEFTYESIATGPEFESTAECSSFGILQEVQPGHAVENADLVIEDIFSVCTSTVIISSHYDSTIHLTAAEHKTCNYTIVLTSDSTVTVTGEVTVTLVSVIPTLTEWGMIIFIVLLLGFMAWTMLRKRRAATLRI